MIKANNHYMVRKMFDRRILYDKRVTHDTATDKEHPDGRPIHKILSCSGIFKTGKTLAVSFLRKLGFDIAIFVN